MPQKPDKSAYTITSACSFEKVIAIFSEIDKKIVSLHECSSQDFLGLNRQFRDFYSESKTISDNAQKVLDLITKDKALEALRNLQLLKEELKSQIGKVELFLTNTGNIIYNTISGIERILFALRNLRQNLVTVKYLITSIKFEASCESKYYGGGEADISGLFSKTEEVIKEIHKYENVFIDIKQALLSNQKKVTVLYEENCFGLDQSFKKITNKIKKLVDMRQSALKAIPRLKTLTEESRRNVSQIITNLQYHDIIKQKIDHIQLTHRNIVEELDSLRDNAEDEAMRHDHAKFFLKIRDIAGLQAAQLIHANKSYQNAIREITSSLRETGENMAGISQLCNQFASQPELFEILHESDLQLQLRDLSGKVDTDKDYIEELSQSTSLAIEKMMEIKRNGSSFEKSCKELTKEITALINHFRADKDNANENSIKQIGILTEESERINSAIIEGIDKESRNLSSLNKSQSSFIAGRSGYLDKLYNTTADLLGARSKTLTEQLNALMDNIREGSNITESIRTSIDKVRYYDYFEKVIEEIISELNDLNYKLKTSDSGNQPSSKEENLGYLKGQYTMESEHKIHESYSKSDHVCKKSYAANEEDSVQDDDNLELF